MVKGKPLSFNQKMDAFLKLAKANPEKSYNQLESIAKERGYSFRRQQMQEALRLFKSEKTIQQAKQKHSRVKTEKIKSDLKKSQNIKRPTVKTQTYENGINYVRTMMPIVKVEKPQQIEQALPAAIKSALAGIKYGENKKKKLKKAGKEFLQLQYVLYGWVDIYRSDEDADDSEEVEGDEDTGGEKIFSGLINSNQYLDFMFPKAEDLGNKLINSWLENFFKIIQSLNGHFKIRYFQTFVSTWKED